MARVARHPFQPYSFLNPQVTKNLLETSRRGYLAASSASAYSFISLLQHFGPHMSQGGATVSLTYFASEKVIPG